MAKAPAADQAVQLHSQMASQPRNDTFVPVVPAGHYEHLHQISGQPYAGTAPPARKRT